MSNVQTFLQSAGPARFDYRDELGAHFSVAGQDFLFDARDLTQGVMLIDAAGDTGSFFSVDDKRDLLTQAQDAPVLPVH